MTQPADCCPSDYCMVTTTTGTPTEAAALADWLVGQRLAACVQLLPIQSVYRWQGAVQHDSETLLLIKTRNELYDAVAAFIASHHRYEVPEVIRIPIEAGSPSYLAWVDSSLSSD